MIVAEGQLRPADWEINPRDYSKCSLPSFGVFGIGRQMARDAQSIDDYHLVELFNVALKKGKGQQDILTGAIYKGAIEHTALKAGGTEDAQMTVASKGAVTTSAPDLNSDASSVCKFCARFSDVIWLGNQW